MLECFKARICDKKIFYRKIYAVTTVRKLRVYRKLSTKEKNNLELLVIYYFTGPLSTYRRVIEPYETPNYLILIKNGIRALYQF